MQKVCPATAQAFFYARWYGLGVMSSSELNVDIEHPGAAISSVVTYTASAGLIANQVWQFLNQYAAGVGATVAILSYLTNVYFNIRNSRAIKARQIDAGDE